MVRIDFAPYHICPELMEDGLPAGLAQAFFQTGGDARPPGIFSLFTSPVTGG
jgi:hypothetical protein